MGRIRFRHTLQYATPRSSRTSQLWCVLKDREKVLGINHDVGCLNYHLDFFADGQTQSFR